jgi:hypothetical protein
MLNSICLCTLSKAFPKLNGDNYYKWAICIKALCLRIGCWKAVKGWDSESVSEMEQRRRDKLYDVDKGI